MTTLEKIKAVASLNEIYMIDVEFRSVIDEYNSQSMENYRPITQMFDNHTKGILQKIQSETHRKFGSSGMVLISQILPALNLNTNHKIAD